MKHTTEHDSYTVFWPGRISAILPGALFAWVALQLAETSGGEKVLISLAWVPSLGVEMTLVLDGLSALFALIITGVGALVVLYANAYMAGHRHIIRFYVYLHAFLLAMLGLVLADNLMALFVFWELTTLFSFLLIGFEHRSSTSRANARQALLVTGAGGLLLLVGIVIIGQVGGSLSLMQLSQAGDLLRDHMLYALIFVSVAAGAFTKSAQVPFHFWLPNAMSAPTPISAFLHSATMVKAGIYLLMRMHPILGGTTLWMSTLVVVGAITAVWGSVVALGQTDLKRVLAYTTVMALGILTMFLGGRTTPALTAAATFLLVHALYKSALFMVVGNIDHQAGTRMLDRLGRLGRRMPLTTAACVAAALSMAGFPLFFGFIGKEIMYKGALTEDMFPGVATTAALSANAMMTAVACIIAVRPFWGRGTGGGAATEAPWPMWIGPLLISAISVGFGLIPDWVSQWLVTPAVLAFHPTTEIVQLKLFYGFNEPLLLSVLTLSLGGLLYIARHKVRSAVQWLLERLPVTMEQMYNLALDAMVWSAGRQTRLLQSGSLFRYLAIIIGTIVAVAGWALLRSGSASLTDIGMAMDAWQWLLVGMMLVSVAIVVRTASRLLAICALGGIGGGAALIFLSHGAPDVALTQLLVETLTLVIAAIVLLRLPRITLKETSASFTKRAVRLSVSLGSGLLVACLLMATGRYDVDRTLTAFFEQASYLAAHGRNVVNVILVDFRSLDTLGEIVVVAASAMAALALIKRRGRA